MTDRKRPAAMSTKSDNKMRILEDYHFKFLLFIPQNLKLTKQTNYTVCSNKTTLKKTLLLSLELLRILNRLPAAHTETDRK